MRVLERCIQPAFSGKCPVQVNQVSITETMLDEAREGCNRLELRRWRLKEENRLSEAQLWSETEKRGHLLTEPGSLRDQRAQIAEMFNMKNMGGDGMTKRRARRRKVFRTQQAEGVGETRRARSQSLAQAAQPVTSEAEQDNYVRCVMQMFVKTLTGKTTTFDDEGQ